MSNPFKRRLAIVIAAIACLGAAPPAGASTRATLALDQSAGDTAGASADLGLDLKVHQQRDRLAARSDHHPATRPAGQRVD